MSRRVWMDVWNDIVRYVIFGDETLAELMLLPEDITIIEFIDKYFIRAGFISTVLTNEPVRIVYGNVSTGNITKYVTSNELTFDIYVKQSLMHNVEKDRLVYRAERISQRIQLLLLNTESIKKDGYNLYVISEGDKSTSTVGYSRYNITFGYKRTY